METRFEFDKEVGQVISCETLHAAAPQTLHQTNHITINKQATAPRPLLFHQRMTIAQRVDAVAAAAGMERAAVLRALLEDYGCDALKEVPRDHYASILSDLNGWLERLGRKPRRKRAARRWAGAARTELAWLRKWAIPLLGVAAAASVLTLAGWSMADPRQRCQWDGREFSIGSVTPMTDTDVYQCVYEPTAHPRPYWIHLHKLDQLEELTVPNE